MLYFANQLMRNSKYLNFVCKQRPVYDNDTETANLRSHQTPECTLSPNLRIS